MKIKVHLYTTKLQRPNRTKMKLTIHTPTENYQFSIYPITTQFSRIAAIYTFIILPTHSQQYTLLYIGITNNLNSRFKTHHKINTAKQLGMTHIGILKKSSGRTRKTIEKNLLKNLNPPLNQTWR